MIQEKSELEDFYQADDPWGYEDNPQDKERKATLLNELERLPKPKTVLDIGCGHGFITRDLPGEHIVGVDLSEKAIALAKKHATRKGLEYIDADMYDLTREMLKQPLGYDEILITGVLYPQYIGDSDVVIYEIIDKLLKKGGRLISVHIDEWYTSRFPYVLIKELSYGYREYQHKLEVYVKP